MLYLLTDNYVQKTTIFHLEKISKLNYSEPVFIGVLTFYIRGARFFARPSQRVFAGELDVFVRIFLPPQFFQLL